MAYARPSSPQSIGGVIDDGIRLFGSAIGRCWLLAIIPGLILLVYEIAFPLPVLTYDVLRRQDLQAWLSPRMATMDLLNYGLTLVFQGAVMVREIAVVRADESCTFGRALGKSLRRLPGMILATLVYGFAIFAGVIALILVAAIVSAAVPHFLTSVRSHAVASGALVLLVLLGFGLTVSVRLQLWTAALFVEDASALGALASSWRLTRGHWWRAGTIFTVAVIMIIVLVLSFSLIGGAIAGLGHFSTRERMIVVYLISLGSNAIYYPLGAAIWLAMYHDFKLRREGDDLEHRVGALSGTA
jgi:hypothetical protein